MSRPAGEYELFSYTPTESQWFGLVVTLNGGDGSVELRRYVRATAAEPEAPAKG